MAQANLDHVRITVVDRTATGNEEKYKQADLYGKSAEAFLNSVKNSPYLSGQVADVVLTPKTNQETGEDVKGNLATIKFFDDAEGNRVDDPKARRYKVQLDRLTFKTTNQSGAEYKVSKPVYRDKEGNVTNLENGKTPGLKSIFSAMNAEHQLFLHVEKMTIDEKDTWVITDAKPLREPSASQERQEKYSLTVTSPEEGKIRIAGPEIKGSEELKSYIKNELGGKWNTKEKAWDAVMPEGMTQGKMYYAVIEKAKELGVKPVSPEAAMSDIASSAPKGGSLEEAAASVSKTKSAKQEMKA